MADRIKIPHPKNDEILMDRFYKQIIDKLENLEKTPTIEKLKIADNTKTELKQLALKINEIIDILTKQK